MQGPLDSLAELGLRPAGPDAMHLTIHFLGDVESSLEEQLVNAIRRALIGVRSFSLKASGAGVFPSSRCPQVLWAGIERSEALIDLHGRLGRAISGLGIPLDERTFRPHLTLARVRSRPSGELVRGIREWSDTWANEVFGIIPVESVILYHSRLGGGPARHTPVKSFRLQ